MFNNLLPYQVYQPSHFPAAHRDRGSTVMLHLLSRMIPGCGLLFLIILYSYKTTVFLQPYWLTSDMKEYINNRHPLAVHAVGQVFPPESSLHMVTERYDHTVLGTDSTRSTSKTVIRLQAEDPLVVEDLTPRCYVFPS